MGNFTLDEFANLLVFSLWFQIAWLLNGSVHATIAKIIQFQFTYAYTNVNDFFFRSELNFKPTFAIVLDIAHYILMCSN